MRRGLLLAVLSTATTGYVSAQSSPGTAGADFVTIEQGARGLGMGGAFTAAVDGADSLWWNPAGLGRARLQEATFSQTLYIQNTATEYAGYVKPLPELNGALGVSFTYLSIPGLDGTDASGNPTGSLKAGGYVGSLSYGTEIQSMGVSAGITGKYISQKLGSNSGTDFAADIGAQYRHDDWGLGVALQNLGPAFKIGSTSDPLPREIRGGGFYNLWDRRVTISFEEEKPYNDSLRAHAGAEWAASQGIRLRTGFEQVPNAGGGAGFTVGFGLTGAFGGGSVGKKENEADAFKPFWERLSSSGPDFETAAKNGAYLLGIDYAFVSDGTLANVHRFTLTARF